jgi:hypothetical protein
MISIFFQENDLLLHSGDAVSLEKAAAAAITTTTMRLDEIEPEEFRRGNVLEVAQFLTKFQSQFELDSLPSGPRKAASLPPTSQQATGGGFIISPADLQNVLDFRSLLDSEKKMEEECYIAEEMGRSSPLLLPLSRRLVNHLRDDLDKIRSQVKDCTTRSKKINFILRRFEVWSTKVVAQDFHNSHIMLLRSFDKSSMFKALR